MQNATFSHEHITLDLSTKERPNRQLNSISDTILEFKHLRERGVDNIVDLTAVGMGRNPDIIQRVKEATGINITLATGYYKEPYLPSIVYSSDLSVLASIMLEEIEQGIFYDSAKAKIKATVIGEIGSSLNKITEVENKIFRAAAIACVNSAIPLVTHTTLATMAIEQTELLKQYLSNLSCVVISHMDLSSSLEYIIKVLDSGVNIGFDTIGKINYMPEETRVEYLYELCSRGYASQIVMSVDITANAQLKNFGGIGYAYLLEKFIPMLYERGITTADVELMMINNPKRIFAKSFGSK